MAMTLAERAANSRQSLINQALLKNNAQSTFYLNRTTLLEPDLPLQQTVEIKKSPEVRNHKWSTSDQALIDWVAVNFHIIETSDTSKTLWQKIQQRLLEGPAGVGAGVFIDGLLFMRQVIEQEIIKRNPGEPQLKQSTQISIQLNDNKSLRFVGSEPLRSLLLSEESGWSNEDQLLVDYFLQLAPEQLPKAPFLLYAGVTVAGTKFFDAIKQAISAGPKGPRARTGALQKDLRRIKEIVCQNMLVV